MVVSDDIDSEIRNLEEHISAKLLTYFQVTIQVSIQSPYQSQSGTRPRARNRCCRERIYDKSEQHLCDASDMVMKDVLLKYISRFGGDRTYLYSCHAGLSNIIRSIVDPWFGIRWFIFLGQYHTVRCVGCASAECKVAFESSGISLLQDGDLESQQKRYVQPGALYSSSKCVDSDCRVSPRYILACLVLAQEELTAKLKEIFSDESERAKMRQWWKAQREQSNGNRWTRAQVVAGIRTNISAVMELHGANPLTGVIIDDVDLGQLHATLAEGSCDWQRYYEYRSLAHRVPLAHSNYDDYVVPYVRELKQVLSVPTVRPDPAKAAENVLRNLRDLSSPGSPHQYEAKRLLDALTSDKVSCATIIQNKGVDSLPKMHRGGDVAASSLESDAVYLTALASYFEVDIK